MNYSQEQVNNIVAEAKQAAEQAARKFFQEKFPIQVLLEGLPLMHLQALY